MKKYNKEDLIEAIKSNDLNHVKYLINVQNVDPSFYNNWAIYHSSTKGFSSICQFLLSDKRVDATNDGLNKSIHYCYEANIKDVFGYLFEVKKVRSIIEKNDLNLYLEYESFYNMHNKIKNF